MQMRDIFGGRLQLTLHELPTLLTHRFSLTFFALSIVAFFATDPPGLRDDMHWSRALMLWPFALCLYLALYVPLLILYARVQMAVPRLPVLMPVIGFLALIPTVYLSENLAHWMSGGTYPIEIVNRFIFFYLSVQVFETVFLRYAIPLVTTDTTVPGTGAPLPAAAVPDPPRTLAVADRRIPFNRLRHIESEEHYVRITLDTDQILLRARLADLIAQTGPGEGCQPHRSWWVSRHAGPRLERRNGRHHLHLADGTEVPVARARLSQVQDWLDRHGTANGADDRRTETV